MDSIWTIHIQLREDAVSAEPTPTHYPQCPYCNAEWSGKGYYVCGTFNNSGCHDTFPQSVLCKDRAAHAATKRELDAMRESRDEANERLAALNEWVGCHAGELAATKRELESAKDLHQQCLNSVTMICVTFPNAAEYVRQLEKQRDSAEGRVAELEELRAKVKKFEPYYLDYISSVSAAGLPSDGPCLACNGFGGHEEGCHGTTGLMTMTYELETLRTRVAELVGLLKSFKQIFRRQMVGDDPLGAKCVFCSYNGPGYWQPGTHSKSCPWHSVGGMDERRKKLSCLTLGQAMPVQKGGQS